ncbi:hypothetical protein KFE25_001614 [Diacronema lutheri]|uniref:Uncharacterized protein n=1 Tax=Diacronema lutheri TaxID=2081491 RepID=A0A8J5XC98_DIALT|nr:hypothetical protein KFE25_001614 [Diacronema lutheri]
MVGMATGTCECGTKRSPMNRADASVCSFDGFDHLEHLCCNCLLKDYKWRYYDDDACTQCRARAREAQAQCEPNPQQRGA